MIIQDYPKRSLPIASFISPASLQQPQIRTSIFPAANHSDNVRFSGATYVDHYFFDLMAMLAFIHQPDLCDNPKFETTLKAAFTQAANARASKMTFEEFATISGNITRRFNTTFARISEYPAERMKILRNMFQPTILPEAVDGPAQKQLEYLELLEATLSKSAERFKHTDQPLSDRLNMGARYLSVLKEEQLQGDGFRQQREQVNDEIKRARALRNKLATLVILLASLPVSVLGLLGAKHIWDVQAQLSSPVNAVPGQAFGNIGNVTANLNPELAHVTSIQLTPQVDQQLHNLLALLIADGRTDQNPVALNMDGLGVSAFWDQTYFEERNPAMASAAEAARAYPQAFLAGNPAHVIMEMRFTKDGTVIVVQYIPNYEGRREGVANMYRVGVRDPQPIRIMDIENFADPLERFLALESGRLAELITNARGGMLTSPPNLTATPTTSPTASPTPPPTATPLPTLSPRQYERELNNALWTQHGSVLSVNQANHSVRLSVRFENAAALTQAIHDALLADSAGLKNALLSRLTREQLDDALAPINSAIAPAYIDTAYWLEQVQDTATDSQRLDADSLRQYIGHWRVFSPPQDTAPATAYVYLSADRWAAIPESDLLIEFYPADSVQSPVVEVVANVAAVKTTLNNAVNAASP